MWGGSFVWMGTKELAMPRKIDLRLFPVLVAVLVATVLVPVFAGEGDVRERHRDQGAEDSGRTTRRGVDAGGLRSRYVERGDDEGVDEPARLLIVTGQNNHDWARTTPMIVAILEAAGDRFVIETTTTPSGGGDDAGWADWRPEFGDYDVVVLDYNGQMWPVEVRESFEQYIEGGGKALLLHAANNAFQGWSAFEQMTGLLWRNADYGDRLYYDDAGELVRVAAGEGPGAGHGPKYDWPITQREEHALFEGMPATWMHAFDELYQGQRGPAEGMTILATAYADPEKGGTGQHEPMLWTIEYGDGLVMTFLAGHLWRGQRETDAFRCVGYRTVLQRACEWLASGEVTVAMPDDFPTATERSVVEE